MSINQQETERDASASDILIEKLEKSIISSHEISREIEAMVAKIHYVSKPEGGLSGNNNDSKKSSVTIFDRLHIIADSAIELERKLNYIMKELNQIV